MKSLGIDCRSINKHMTGVGNVLYNTLLRLKLNNCEVTLFFDRELDENEKLIYKNLGYNIKIIKIKNYLVWEQIVLPLVCRKKYDYIWFPSNTGSIFIKSKIISTIHDVIFNKSIKEIPLSGVLKKDIARIYRKIVVKIIAKKSKRIYTVSNYSKNDIALSYKIDKNKIKVIHNGLNEFFKDYEKEKNNKDNYILSFGSNEPRKNTELMIHVYKYFIERYGNLNNVKLVLYGFKGYENSKAKKLINKYKLKNKVIIYDYVTNEQLKILYKKAKVFCFLSSYEGFGLPILESMACGTPVIALDNSSITEIVDEYGILIKDVKIEKIAEEIYLLYTDEKLRNKYVELGYKNSNNYQWSKSINILNEDINRIISSI